MVQVILWSRTMSKKCVEIEALHHVEGAALLQDRDKESRRRVGQGGGHQHAHLFREFPLGHLDLRHVGGDPVGAHHALGFAGGAAGEVDRGNIVGGDIRGHQRLWFELAASAM